MSSYQNDIRGSGGIGESEPLMNSAAAKNGHSDSPSPMTKRQGWNVQTIVGIVAALLLAIALFLNVFVPRKTTVTQLPLTTAKEPLTTTVTYRPLCEVHSDRFVAIQGIQTSMKDPSHQWAPLACQKVVAKQKSSFLFASPAPPPQPVINTFQAPDALMQVNFSKHAFPGRPPILGFGGAFTEASARNFFTLSQEGQETVLELLFGKDGLGYALGRVHMNSCDFSVKSYTFDDTDGDFELKNFDMQVTHDVETGMVDFAKRATKKLRQDWTTDESGQDGNLKLYMSPWSPPPWMKRPTWQDLTNATHATNMTYSTQPSCLRFGTDAKSKYAAAWALYFSKFLTAYANLGLPFWGVTVQNEPEFPAPWEACSMTPQTEAQFVANHLGPRLRQDHPDVKLFIFDHNKDHIMKWTKKLLNQTKPAAQYVDGTAYHWYAGGMDRLLDGALGISNLHRLQHELEAKKLSQSHLLLGSEACHCPSTGYAGGDINVYWARAERYVHTMLADLAAGGNAWVEWNLILDGIGGPNHLGNLCESTLLAVPYRAKDASADIPTLPEFEVHFPMGNVSIGDGRTREELNALGFPAKYLDKGVAVQPIYFYTGHVSRFVRPGSRSVPGIITQGNASASHRIFRPEGSVVTGGGQNDLARVGIEVTLWPCEGSTRQQFSWKNESSWGNPIVVHGHDWLGHPTTSCISNTEDSDYLGLRMEGCNEKTTGFFDIVPVPNDPLGRSRIYLKNFKGKTSDKKDPCLVVRKLMNDGGAYGPRGGALVTIGTCNNSTSLWSFDSAVGELSSFEFASVDEGTGLPKDNEAVCTTTGWPFLQMGAFASPNSNKTVVILNEANDPANYALVDNGELVLTGSVPPRSVQTFQLQEKESE